MWNAGKISKFHAKIEVPHAHVHLMPINNANDINFTRGKLNMSKEELKTAQEKILMAMES